MRTENNEGDEKCTQKSPFCISKVVPLPGGTPGRCHGVTMTTASSVCGFNLITPHLQDSDTHAYRHTHVSFLPIPHCVNHIVLLSLRHHLPPPSSLRLLHSLSLSTLSISGTQCVVEERTRPERQEALS